MKLKKKITNTKNAIIKTYFTLIFRLLSFLDLFNKTINNCVENMKRTILVNKKRSKVLLVIQAIAKEIIGVKKNKDEKHINPFFISLVIKYIYKEVRIYENMKRIAPDKMFINNDNQLY
ncbi:hypothetical protein C0585_07770 [Candidatus Woesearchaeota archaeon]|nr:MAG: hypothetical protein C0585_07770 [Candidatus Woesearchaeota archaeon]